MKKFLVLLQQLSVIILFLFSITLSAQTWTAYNGCPPSFTDLNATYLKKCYSTSSTFTNHFSYLNYSTGTSGSSHTVITTGGNDLNAFIPTATPYIYLQKLPTWDGIPQTQVAKT